MSESGLFPFVRLIEAPGTPYREGERFVEAIAVQREIDMRERESSRPAPSAATGRFSRKTIDNFRSNARYGGDATREDLAYAIYSLAHGADAGQVSIALRSRDLSHKGDDKRQNQYVDRTIAKALRVMESGTKSR
jgi:hypothetical protein